MTGNAEAAAIFAEVRKEYPEWEREELIEQGELSFLIEGQGDRSTLLQFSQLCDLGQIENVLQSSSGAFRTF